MVRSMLELAHQPLSPFCRKIRLMLAEKRLEFSLKEEQAWPPSDEVMRINPAGTLPILFDEDEANDRLNAIMPASAIAEYLEERHPDPTLIPGTPEERAECRRIVAWFDDKFHSEVTINLLFEKLQKRVAGMGPPDMDAVREGISYLNEHLDYLGSLADDRRWLAGDEFSLADITAAAHISSIDYLGDVPWWTHDVAKIWYTRLKSRPSFRPLLADRVPGLPPPRHYADLDF